ncbi:NitT/TauT family transport system permease protein [Marinobacterium sp. MBR-111]|jgi:NitT/TauT family transport system permease protein|uniref:ABC transporter permease n=1 Tax=Marinobacterium sp. MBR-111 TaxID=3156463 RepID=UPI00339241B6
MTRRLINRMLPLYGLGFALLGWWLGVSLLAHTLPIASSLGPMPTFEALQRLLQDGYFYDHIQLSLQRVGVGLLFAVLIGIPLGVLTGMSRCFARASSPLFQFMRMISPLSWMPIAVMVLGVGNAPVYFLLAFAAVWPILLNTATGVGQLDKNWLLLSQSLSATRSELVLRLVLPGITAHILTGVRLAIGIIWIVLVPAEMLGVTAGLGYFILDTRDRLAYDELMAGILVIGLIGFLLDWFARWLHRCWTHDR